MGLFRRKRAAPAPLDLVSVVAGLPAVDLPRGARVGVAGASYHQGEIRKALERAAPQSPPGVSVDLDVDRHILGWITALVVAEDNPHDPFADAVYAAGISKVGYIDRKHSEEWRHVIAEYVYPRGGKVGRCPAYIHQEESMLGVRLITSTAWYLLHNLDEDA